jgi:hypothetical protein
VVSDAVINAKGHSSSREIVALRDTRILHIDEVTPTSDPDTPAVLHGWMKRLSYGLELPGWSG